MRHFVPALLGLALAAPVAALAQSNDCRDCSKGYVVQPAQVPGGFRAPRLCSDCYKKYKQTGVWPGPNPPPGVMAATPNYGMPGQPMMADNGAYAPGYAMTGEPTSPYDPAPVGVMRTNYRSSMGMMPGPDASMGMPPGHAMSGMQPPMQGPVAPYWGSESTLLAGPKTRDRNMFASLMGWNWWQKWGAQRDAKRSAMHAREAYGMPGGSADSLPPRMVFGR